MNSTSLLEFWRSQIMDQARPYLWSDDEAFVYMNEAQNQFCRKTEGISDATTAEVVQIPVVTGEIFAKAHPKILAFRTAYLLSTGADVTIKNHTDVRKWDNASGSIDTMIIGMEKNVVRWGKTPVVDDEVELLVFRLPLVGIDDVEQELEVEDTHHASLSFWMSHLAYLKPDTETFDKQASDRAKANFESYCAQAASEQRRNKQYVRTVAYGGI